MDENSTNDGAGLKSKVISGLKWTAFARVTAQTFSWAMSIVVIRFLTPEDYGLKAMAEVLFSFLLMISSAGIGAAIIQATKITEHNLKQIFGILIIFNVVLCGLQLVAAPFIADYYNEERITVMLQVLALGFLVLPLKIIPFSLLGREMEFKKRSFAELIAAVLSGVITLVLAYLGYGVWSLIIGQLAGLLLQTIGFQIACTWIKLPSFNFTGAGDLLKFGGIITGTDLLYYLYSTADVIIAGPILGTSLLGVYSVALHLASLPRLKLLPLIHQIAFPAYSKIKDKLDEIQWYFIKSTRLVSLLLFPFLFGFAGVAEPFVYVVLGEEWKDAIVPLILLSLSMPIRSMRTLFSPVLNAMGRPGIDFENGMVTLILSALAIYVGSFYGVVGVCVAWLIVSPITFIYSAIRAFSVIQVSMGSFLASMWPATMAGSIMCACLYGVQQWLGTNSHHWWVLIIMIIFGATIYSGIMFSFYRPYIDEIKDLLKK